MWCKITTFFSITQEKFIFPAKIKLSGFQFLREKNDNNFKLDNYAQILAPNLNFLAPEIVFKSVVKPNSDIFSLGLIMYYIMSNGKLLINNGSTIELNNNSPKSYMKNFSDNDYVKDQIESDKNFNKDEIKNEKTNLIMNKKNSIINNDLEASNYYLPLCETLTNEGKKTAKNGGVIGFIGASRTSFGSYNYENLSNESNSENLQFSVYLIFQDNLGSISKELMLKYAAAFYEMFSRSGNNFNGIGDYGKIDTVDFYNAAEGNQDIKAAEITISLYTER